MNLRLTQILYLVLTTLRDGGYHGYLVGGALRDFLMGRVPSDIDITTDANKDEILRLFKKYKTVDVGTKYGTVLVIIAGIQLEITPHRYESNYRDHRHPENISFTNDLVADLGRRDFTINAIAYSPDTGIVDYFGGRDDINKKIIRTVGDPNHRFDEDALRILRAVRFSFTLGFEIDERTYKAIFDSKDLLSYISIERKMAELKKLLSVDVYPNINKYKDILNTFILMKDTDKLVDSFNNWLIKLAYILDESFVDKVHTLKLSNDETKLVKTLILSKQTDFNDDFNFAKTVSESSFKNELLTFKSVIDNKNYFEKMDKLSDRIIDDLIVKGYDLINLGYSGSIIRRIRNDLKDQIYTGNFINTKAPLIEYVKKNYNNVMELRLLTKDEYLKYFNEYKYTHFMQSPGFGEVNETRGYKVYYLGFFKNKENLGLCMCGKKKILNYSSFYAPRGILCDYTNKESLSEIVAELKKFLKKEKALYFKMDPGIIIRLRNLKSEIIKEYETINLIDNLKELGFKHRGFSFDLVDSSQPRFTFRLDINKDEKDILKGMNSTNRNLLKREFPELVITKNKIEEFPLFYDTMRDTAIRENLFLPDISFYENFYNNLSKYNSSDLYVATVDINKIIDKDSNRIKELEELNNSLLTKARVTTKDENQVNNNNDIIKKLNKELLELNEFKDQKIALSSVITAKDKDKVWIVFGGNKNILKILNANYHLYWKVIKDAKAEGFKTVDFFGTHGKPETDNPEYGLFLYKSKFGGDFDEFIGEFDLIINPFMNKVLMGLVKLRRKIKQMI